MSNMGYCRFRNTLGDLEDCEDYFHDVDLSEEEGRARARMVDLMCRVLQDFGCEVEDPRNVAQWLYEP